MNRSLIIAASDTGSEAAGKLGAPTAHLSCSFDKLRPPPEHIRGGLLAVGGDIRASLSGQLIEICLRHGFRAVIMGFGFSAQLDTLRICSALGRQGIRAYLTREAWVSGCGAKALISSAVTGGSYRQMIGDAVKKYGANNIALDLERLRHSFTLPCRDGRGAYLRTLPGEASYFSEELCCRYITRENGKSFVLFDDTETARLKTDIAAESGISEVFALYPEWSLDELKQLQRNFLQAGRVP